VHLGVVLLFFASGERLSRQREKKKKKREREMREKKKIEF